MRLHVPDLIEPWRKADCLEVGFTGALAMAFALAEFTHPGPEQLDMTRLLLVSAGAASQVAPENAIEAAVEAVLEALATPGPCPPWWALLTPRRPR